MFVLGIDPGLTRCGFGVIEGSLKNVETFTALRAGVLESPAEWPVERRLASLLVDLRELMADVRPDVVVVERVFFQRNARTAISVAQASGIAIGLAGDVGAPVRQFTAQEVKLAVTGYGAADKAQVQEMIKRLLHLDEIPKPDDAADGLSIALCHIHIMR